MSRFENQCDDFRLFNLISVFQKTMAPPPTGGEGTQRHPQGQHQAKGGVDSGTALLSSPSSLLTLPFSLFLSSPPPPSSRADKETSSITQKESVGEQAAAPLQRKEGQTAAPCNEVGERQRPSVGDRGVRKQRALEARRTRALTLVAEGGCRDNPSVVVFQSSLHVTRHQRPRVGSRPRRDNSVFIRSHIRA